MANRAHCEWILFTLIWIDLHLYEHFLWVMVIACSRDEIGIPGTSHAAKEIAAHSRVQTQLPVRSVRTSMSTGHNASSHSAHIAAQKELFTSYLAVSPILPRRHEIEQQVNIPMKAPLTWADRAEFAWSGLNRPSLFKHSSSYFCLLPTSRWSILDCLIMNSMVIDKKNPLGMPLSHGRHRCARNSGWFVFVSALSAPPTSRENRPQNLFLGLWHSISFWNLGHFPLLLNPRF